MHKWFSRLLITLGIVGTSTVFLLFSMLFFLPQETAIYEFFRIVLRGLIWSLPLLILAAIFTGFTSYMEIQKEKKQKSDFIPYNDFEDVQFESMMNQLSAQEDRLAEGKADLDNEGEVVSLEELLSEQSKELTGDK